MAINVACPSCGRQYNVKDDAAGKRFKCKDCEAVIEVPGAAGGGDEFGGDDFGEPYDPYGNAAEAGGAPAPIPARRRQSSSGGAAASAAAERTKLPAIFMYIVCGISIGYSVLNLTTQALGLQGPMPQFGPADQQAAMQIGHTLGLVLVGLFIIRDIFLIYAFSRMQMVTAYGVAFAGAVISVIPCLGSPCCALGIPFGIWALVVLNDPVVKAAFR